MTKRSPTFVIGHSTFFRHSSLVAHSSLTRSTHRMNKALLLLLRLHARATVRRAVRSVRTPKGAVFVLVGVVVFFAWLVPVFVSSHFAHMSDPQTVRLVAPLVLLFMCGLTLVGGAGERAISFTQGEVNFLFPGPLTRRE